MISLCFSTSIKELFSAVGCALPLLQAASFKPIEMTPTAFNSLTSPQNRSQTCQTANFILIIESCDTSVKVDHHFSRHVGVCSEKHPAWDR
ncbi:hypothetical protein BJ508DRAFT_113863 [Ascobolus immersus RN42]|uniref:Uncharacterized protein n=1 Tax=Ascobolus immersus RN42 TaxID=1160509 RepID=A0A3N4I5J6_ASCIM|nr:hypothetical protein BJ508DRAFT_113863 [Ascobolus immersus RN42]